MKKGKINPTENRFDFLLLLAVHKRFGLALANVK